jgi:hypothetical protein
VTGKLDLIADRLALQGLILRGGLAFGSSESRPAGPTGVPASVVLLAGNAGARYWRHFRQWLQTQPVNLINPLDTWSREIIGAIASEFGGLAASPSDRPFLPFQQWAMRAEGLRPSPLGILMHPQYGLWHAWRGALIFGEGDVANEVRALNQAPAHPIHLCDLCIEKPCTKTCPVAAHSGAGFDYQSCLSHVRSARGAQCRTDGCLDRNACPYGAEWRYPAEVQAFHMKAFARE